MIWHNKFTLTTLAHLFNRPHCLPIILSSSAYLPTISMHASQCNRHCIPQMLGFLASSICFDLLCLLSLLLPLFRLLPSASCLTGEVAHGSTSCGPSLEIVQVSRYRYLCASLFESLSARWHSVHPVFCAFSSREKTLPSGRHIVCTSSRAQSRSPA